MQLLKAIGDTDPHGVILTMAAFVQEMRFRNDQDGQHALPPSRLIELFQNAVQLEPNLFLDVDAGLRLLQTSVKIPSNPKVRRIDQAYGFDYTLRFHIEWKVTEPPRNYPHQWKSKSGH